MAGAPSLPPSAALLCGRRCCSCCRMLRAGSVFLAAKTKTKLFIASPPNKMMQEKDETRWAYELSGWASGQTVEDNHLLFAN